MPVIRSGSMYVRRTPDGVRIFTVGAYDGGAYVPGRYYDSDRRVRVHRDRFNDGTFEPVKVSGETRLPAGLATVDELIGAEGDES